MVILIVVHLVINSRKINKNCESFSLYICLPWWTRLSWTRRRWTAWSRASCRGCPGCSRPRRRWAPSPGCRGRAPGSGRGGRCGGCEDPPAAADRHRTVLKEGVHNLKFMWRFNWPYSFAILQPSVPSMFVVGTNWRLPSFKTEATILKISHISSVFRPISSIARWKKINSDKYSKSRLSDNDNVYLCSILKRQTISKINHGFCQNNEKKSCKNNIISQVVMKQRVEKTNVNWWS